MKSQRDRLDVYNITHSTQIMLAAWRKGRYSAVTKEAIPKMVLDDNGGAQILNRQTFMAFPA